MPTTKFRLKFDNNKSYGDVNNPDFNIYNFQKTLPNLFSITIENGEFYIIVETKRDDDTNYAIPLVERELKRCYFLTNIKTKQQYVNASGRVPMAAGLNQINSYTQNFPTNIAPQDWNDRIELQLNLWFLANESSDKKIKVLLLFQIIELSGHTFKVYRNSGEPPDPFTECRLLRHLVAHSDILDRKEMKTYFKYLENNKLISTELFRSMLNSETSTAGFADSKFESIFLKKIRMIEEQAKIKIFEQISRT